ncbi:TPA: PAS domain S-box protein [Methanosarcina acetivorans]|nr:PAS domain S-box protein [Methanosarcina acetivorans]HIH95608.1 PAS domain S-box protein [Methanosarcina acetivorans]
MNTKMEQFPTNNPNPVLSVKKDGTVLYSNKVGELLLHKWGVKTGEKLPPSIGDIVQSVISRNSPEKIEIKVEKNVYLVVFHPLLQQECVTISGFDISDQKELEGKLRENEIYLDAFSLTREAVQICELVLDDKGHPVDFILLDVNPAYEKYSGLRREHVVGKHLKEVLPVVEQVWLDRYREVVRTGKGMRFEEYNSSLNRWFEVFASPMGGNLFAVVFNDITERKQAGEALFKSEQHHRLLHETMLQGVVYHDASGKIISMNPAAERILGKTPVEFLGSSSVGEEHLTIREDGSPFPGLEHPAMVSLRTGEKVQDVVMGVYNLRENCYRWININAVPIFRTGEDKPFQVYTLFDDITERKQEERRIYRYNRILEGINRIFSNVVQAKTEEELGNECLSVALEITGSQFGFINEMGVDGLLHDVAKSQLAWEQCLMDDKTGHRRSPSDFIVHGLYGSVIINEKSFFTNDPQSHPDSIGVPPGHPPLTSFLGVPLVQKGKTVGLIAVANRENGYNCEQLEDLEAIAPAVAQVLQRKREEQERMKAEEALSRERSMLESVMQTTDVMLVLLDPQFNFVWVNPAYAETCKLKPEEMVGKNHFVLYPDAENEAIFRTVRDTGKEVFYKDKPFVFPDQPERGVTYWDWSLTPVKNSSGDVEGLVFSLRETTKYKKVEEALRESEERLRLLGDNLPDSAIYQYVHEPDGDVRFLYISSGIERLNGVNVRDVLHDPDTLYRQVPPEYLERLFEAKARSARELSDVDMELPMQLPDGQVKWMRLHSRPRRLPDGRTIWDGVQIDITENKKVEEALKKAHETLEEKVKERTAELEEAYNSLKESERGLAEAQKMAHVGNWYNDLVTDKAYWSEEMYRIFGFNPQEDINYDKFLSYVHPDDRDYVYNSTKEAFDGKIYATNYRIVRPDGEERIVHSEREVLFDEKNNPVRIKGTVQDITESKKAEEALEKMDKARIKEIHHRIKNNLQIISSLLDLQAEKFEDKNVTEAFREGQNRVISMSLIHEELYKGEGTDTLDFSVYLKKLAENLFQTYNLSSKNINLSMDLEKDTFLDMDTAVPLGIIVNELVSNSLKHAFIEEGKVRINLCREERNYDTNESLFSLTISDNGKGMPEDLELESAESLGLQLVNILVDQLDGELELKRAQGTEFTIRFKVVEKDNPAQVGLKSQENE